jgi:glutamyl-Q tRNA(Asp) synthetase
MRTRFAPSPSGPLHLGHALSAITAAHLAHHAGGQFLLRIEDIDSTRCRPEWENMIYQDLAWLGLDWPRPVWRQSDHLDDYDTALAHFDDLGLIYPCSCSRADIKSALGTQAPVYGPDGIVYPGTCRRRPMKDRQPGDALRLNMRAALAHLGQTRFVWRETGFMPGGQAKDCTAGHLLHQVGDIVLIRRLTGDPAYHLAVIVDDAAQGITHVCRGRDLLQATPLHVMMQTLLGLPVPDYHHHRLITDETGKRLSKTDKARALHKYRDAGLRPYDVFDMIEVNPPSGPSIQPRPLS